MLKLKRDEPDRVATFLGISSPIIDAVANECQPSDPSAAKTHLSEVEKNAIRKGSTRLKGKGVTYYGTNPPQPLVPLGILELTQKNKGKRNGPNKSSIKIIEKLPKQSKVVKFDLDLEDTSKSKRVRGSRGPTKAELE